MEPGSTLLCEGMCVVVAIVLGEYTGGEILAGVGEMPGSNIQVAVPLKGQLCSAFLPFECSSQRQPRLCSVSSYRSGFTVALIFASSEGRDIQCCPMGVRGPVSYDSDVSTTARSMNSVCLRSGS